MLSKKRQPTTVGRKVLAVGMANAEGLTLHRDQPGRSAAKWALLFTGVTVAIILAANLITWVLK